MLLAILATQLAAPPPPSQHLKVDQFGYLTGAGKLGILSEPLTGYNAPGPFTPAPTVEIRRWSDDSLAWSGAATPWRSGSEHAQSGDRVWSADFSSLTESGSFYLFDPASGFGSGRFEIGPEVYRDVMGQALRSFFYQRCGQDRSIAWSDPRWVDTACHQGPEQDRDCRSVLDTRPQTARDLSGGWHDAGDYNKYVNFADDPIHDLLSAWEQNPDVWTDDLGLPESGNCVPDLLDELKWELDWLLRMQLPDGSVLHKVSVTDFSAGSPPSRDGGARRYAPPTASATISAAGAFAHAARIYQGLADPGLQAFGATLESAARAAWAWLDGNPGRIPSSYDNQGFQNAAAEDGAYEQAANRTCAAVWLWSLTRDPAYRAYVDGSYTQLHLLQWGYAYVFESSYQDCLLFYASDPGATPAVASDIRSAYLGSLAGADHHQHLLDEDDPYRAWLDDADYTWGSNRNKAQYGSLYLNLVVHGLDPARDPAWRRAAEGYLHYLHGTNPVGLVYLAAMEPWGAERAVSEFYHSWFGDGTPWDSSKTSLHGPAPGFLPGGPNPYFQPDPSYTGPRLAPPLDQPVQKSYRDWNTSWPENSWEVTENQVAYQASYLKLLAAFLAAVPPPGPPASPGSSLRAARRGADVELSWSAAAGATGYAVLGCDAASLRPCVPVPITISTVTSHLEVAPTSRLLWYRIEAVNGCGSTP